MTSPAVELISFLDGCGEDERDEILSLVRRIVTRSPYACTNEDMGELRALADHLRRRVHSRSASGY